MPKRPLIDSSRLYGGPVRYPYLIQKENCRIHDQDVEAAQFLIQNHLADIEGRSSCEDGYTPLLYAAAMDWPEKVQLLVRLDADKGARTIRDKDTPLHLGAGEGNSPDIVHTLISDGADISATNRYGRTALHVAAAYSTDNTEVVEELRWCHNNRGRRIASLGLDVNARDKSGMTALHVAADSSTEHLRVVNALLEWDGVDVNVEDNRGMTAFDYSELQGFAETTRRLHAAEQTPNLRGIR